MRSNVEIALWSLLGARIACSEFCNTNYDSFVVEWLHTAIIPSFSIECGNI